ncbi:restriction endonuclease subunit S [Methylovulum psychrotolerans]|uniref:Type I restriction modification DNA specificity domain-containing protein n=1 Tax=Methylovulum psychrotolerans TaxID=1704499 RepID=A0A1Z4C2U0_9GAMM|nr:restriction endonuclease subunit S [Methylovulum psychrotolerans]ASF47829.1 hypothetical protein CEK71_18130 [Methylovulum psychrotolerans]
MENTKKVPVLRFPEFSEEWVVKKIKDISTIKSGSTPLRSNKDFFKNGHIWWVKTTDLNNSNIIKTEECITELALKETSVKIYPKNSVLVAMYGGFNQIGRTGILKVDATTNQALSILNTNEKVVLPQYLLTWLNAKVNLWRKFAGSSRKDPNITGSDVAGFPISFPQISEQQKIADFLLQIDNRIEKLIKKKQLLEKYKKGVMQNIFNQELRFKDNEGNDYPDWEEKELGDISDVRDGTHDSPKYHQNGFAFITSKNLLANGSIDFENVSLISELDFNNFNKRSKVDIGDILFGMIGTIGNPVLIKTSGFAIKNVALIKEKQELKNIFLVHYLNSSLVLKQFDDVTVGNTQKFIALGKIRKLKIHIPSLPEQTKIAKFLTEIDEKINQASKQLEGTKKYKKGLLQQMFV